MSRTLSLRQARILILDDEVGNLCLCVNILHRLGFKNVLSISDSRDVFDQAAEFQPDLLLLDLNMPHLDGFEVLERFRLEPETVGDFPIIVMTEECTIPNKRRALSGGASDILNKPFDTAELNVRISNVLQARLLRRQIESQNEALEQRVAERTTELEKALAELKATQRQMLQQERLRAFGEMASGVAHDFNNALMSVIGYSDILLEDPDMLNDRETVLEYLRVMNTAGRDASNVVGRLRDFYRAREEGDLFVALDLNKLVEQVVPLTQPKWRDQALATGRTIDIQLDLEKVPPVAGNAAELREVATNLIFNAVDAMPGGGVITLRTRSGNGSVILEVCDTGAGMSDDVRTRCLEPFFSTKGDRGTGLGLSMVFGIIKRHEGDVDIESVPGKGTTLRIRLPSTNREVDSDTIIVPKPDRSLYVLVVDDDVRSRDVLEKYLEADGHRVETAANGLEALERFGSKAFDLLATDYAMPGLNGLQLAEKLRRNRSNLSVLLVSGFTDAGLPEGTDLDLVDAVIHKPVHGQDLRAAIFEILKRGDPGGNGDGAEVEEPDCAGKPDAVLVASGDCS